MSTRDSSHLTQVLNSGIFSGRGRVIGAKEKDAEFSKKDSSRLHPILR